MCGIAGSASQNGSVAGQRERVEAQLATLTHRGPDSSGIYAQGAAAIGQTRLAVIDLVTGDPPITNEDGRVGVALNGEIYNFASLREELLGKGHRFRTAGDTEVIAHLAEDLEPCELARSLDGMFAFAVWDERRRRLILARDRMGKKPLYYWAGEGRVVFGSELKAVLADPAVPRHLDPDAIPAYLTFGYVPTPRTFFDGVFSLPPGHVLVADRGLAPRVEQYWDPAVSGTTVDSDIPASLDQAASKLLERLRTAVGKRLVADVPLGAFLSGGIDSSTVVALMAELSARPVRTFTIGFDDGEGYDERPFARQVADRFGTDHTEFVVQPDAVELVERLVHHHDQPFGDASAVPTFLLSELTRAHVTVALCGDGGDELFAGYQRFSAAVAMRHLQRLPAPIRRMLQVASARVPHSPRARRARSVARFVAASTRPMPDYYRAWISYVPDDVVGDLLANPSKWAIDAYDDVWRASEGAPFVDRLLDLNLRTYLPDDLLPKVDRMSMAHALEVRSPFLDIDVVRFALSLPSSMKLRGWSRKRVLRKAIEGFMPREILRRPKRGFGVPLDRWFRSDLRPYVEAGLMGPNARLRQHLRP
ncbi:MAG: asparagine synthase (glutamine-hydrolyzing), partial [Acidimicrobiales bacterium]